MITSKLKTGTFITGIACCGALLLAACYVLIKSPVDDSELTRKKQLIHKVVPAFDHLNGEPVIVNDGNETMKIYKAYDSNDQFTGAAVESSSNNGYIGKINILVGFNKQGIVTNYLVLSQNETPGMGAKMVNWFKSGSKDRNITGKNPAIINLSVRKDGGDIDGITSATISSRAFLFAVRNAYQAYMNNCLNEHVDGTSGASKTR